MTAQDEILQLTGNEKWSDIVEWLGGKSLQEIRNEFDSCWPEDQNEDLALMAFDELN